MLDLTSLDLFMKAAELGSLTRVAGKANLALGAVSRRLAQLEAHYGVSLLVRNGRGVVPTPAGQALLTRAQAIFREINLASADLSDYAKGIRGSISLSASTSAITQFLPADLAEFSAAHPGVRLNIREAYSGAIQTDIRSGAADVGIVVNEGPMPGLRVWPYRGDRLGVVVPNGFRPDIDKTRFVDLIGEDFVQMGFNTVTTRILAAAADKIGAALRLRIQVDSFDAVCRMIQSGFGIAILPIGAARSQLSALGLRAIELDEPWAERVMCLCANAQAELSNAATQLIDHLTARTSL